MPAGEFYGEFARFTVDLDLPEDQVMGATGVPVCGDPGWERANRQPGRPVEYQRDYYGASTPSADACAGAAPGRKRIRWYAERVHHFAMSLNPAYRYEGGHFGDVAVHVLYQAGDDTTWGRGVAVKRTETALAWLDQLYGSFGWPQITNVHRIEGGGTEFPMMIHDGSADQGLIVHELGHNYTMGLLANNEWREGWLDEGFTSFQTSWFWEVTGKPPSYPETEAQILDLDLDDYTEPPSLEAQAYRDFASYNIAIYTRGELFFHQLRAIVGDDVMHRILQAFYERWKYHHVDEAAFRAVAEEVSHRDLSTFFAQWLHTTDLYDYAVGRTRTARHGDRWVTRVEVVRRAPGRFPQDVVVLAAGDTAVTRTEGLAEREWVELTTRTKPKQVVLDPLVRSHDWNMLNNRRLLGFQWPQSLAPSPETDVYLHRYFSTRSRRDRLTLGLQPVAWYNDAGGVTFGLRGRGDYLGRFEQNVAIITGSTGWGVDDAVHDVDFWFRVRNPVSLRAPNLSQTLDVYNVEGRFGATGTVERTRRAHLTFGPQWTQSVTLHWARFQEEVGHSFPNIAPFLEMGRLVGIEGNVVTIGFTKQATVARAMLEKADNMQALTSLCERMSGQSVRLRVVELTEADPPGPTMAQIRAAKEQEQKLILFERAKAHPVVKQALEIFGAELADVRTVPNGQEVQEGRIHWATWPIS